MTSDDFGECNIQCKHLSLGHGWIPKPSDHIIVAHPIVSAGLRSALPFELPKSFSEAFKSSLPLVTYDTNRVFTYDTIATEVPQSASQSSRLPGLALMQGPRCLLLVNETLVQS